MLQSLKNGATSLAILEGAEFLSCCEGQLTRTVNCTEEGDLVFEASVKLQLAPLAVQHCNFDAEKSTAASCNVPKIAHFDGLKLT